MRCPGANEMAAWLDGALAGPEKRRFDEHLARCRRCRLAMEELSLLVGLKPVEAGEACLARGKALVGAAGSHPVAGLTPSGRFVPAQYN